MNARVPLFFACVTVLPLFGVETTIKGGRMELINQGDNVLFTNGVRLDRGTDQLKSNRMKTNKARNKVTAEGNVCLFRQVSSTETWQGFGETGFYDTQLGAGYLLGAGDKKAHVIHTEVLSSTSSRVVHVYANRIDFFRETRKAVATGQVQGQTVDPDTDDRYDFWADQADFDGEKKEVILSGASQPVVKQVNPEERKTIIGDKIVYSADSKRLLSEGNAQALFEDTGQKKPK